MTAATVATVATASAVVSLISRSATTQLLSPILDKRIIVAVPATACDSSAALHHRSSIWLAVLACWRSQQQGPTQRTGNISESLHHVEVQLPKTKRDRSLSSTGETLEKLNEFAVCIVERLAASPIFAEETQLGCLERITFQRDAEGSPEGEKIMKSAVTSTCYEVSVPFERWL